MKNVPTKDDVELTVHEVPSDDTERRESSDFESVGSILGRVLRRIADAHEDGE